tara:strand:+ start:717 stop:1352 length:636 start_codon:yes stop_codon:yes gene_type:complete
MAANNNCDGGGPHTSGTVKLYPIGGGGNLILCHRCWARENRYNAERGRETGCPENFPQVDWRTANVYDPEEARVPFDPKHVEEGAVYETSPRNIRRDDGETIRCTIQMRRISGIWQQRHIWHPPTPHVKGTYAEAWIRSIQSGPGQGYHLAKRPEEPEPTTTSTRVRDGCFAVILARMEALAIDIKARDWDGVEFQFDRVLRAVTKAREAA